MRIAVTGASGHVGANLVRKLIELNHEVTATVHNSRRALRGLSVHTVSADLLEPASLDHSFAGVELVYHLAARISIAPGDESLVHATNVTGARNVVDACLRTGVRRLVHFSSIHALSSQPSDQAIDESRGLATGERLLAYDRSKAAAEREVQAGIARGLDAVVLNPTAILGPHDYGPSPMGTVLLDLFFGRLPALVEGGFDWVDVRDVVEGAVRAAERGRSGERYLLSGHRRSLRQVAQAVEDATGKRAPRLAAPMWLARAGAPFVTAFAQALGKSPRLTRASLHALRNHQWVSHAKASRELNYEPRAFEETIEDTFRWFRSAGVLG